MSCRLPFKLVFLKVDDKASRGGRESSQLRGKGSKNFLSRVFEDLQTVVGLRDFT